MRRPRTLFGALLFAGRHHGLRARLRENFCQPVGRRIDDVEDAGTETLHQHFGGAFPYAGIVANHVLDGFGCRTDGTGTTRPRDPG